MSPNSQREIQILKMNPWQKFILETLAGFETPTTNETKSPDTPSTGCRRPRANFNLEVVGSLIKISVYSQLPEVA